MGKNFPDLTGDGKVTRADVLEGRGVFKKVGRKAKKMKPGGPIDPTSLGTGKLTEYAKGLFNRFLNKNNKSMDTPVKNYKAPTKEKSPKTLVARKGGSTSKRK